MKLAEFLLARIAEDEADARRVDESVEGLTWRDLNHTLAYCAAQRRVVDLFEMVSEDGGSLHSDAWIVARQAALELAAAYSDDPSYREEWKP